MKKVTRRDSAQVLLAAASALAWPAWAHSFPTRPIAWVVPYSPGAATDILTRRLAKEIAADLGQSVLVENLPGGGSTLAAGRLANEKPDGYRIITMDVAGLAIHPGASDKLSYDPNRSFTPITMGWRVPFVLVTAPQGPKTLGELVERAKAKPGAMTYGSAGIGSAIHLAMVLLEDLASVQLTHVPYGGAANALVDVLAGRVDAMFISLGAAMAHLKSERLRALGASGTARFEAMPALRTIAEQGYSGYEASSWQGVLAPAGLPNAIRDHLQQAIAKALTNDDVIERFKAIGAQPESSTPQAFAAYILSEGAKWARLIRAKSIRIDL